MHIFEAGVRLGDCGLQRIDLFTADAGIDVVAIRSGRCERGTCLVRLCRQFHRGELRQHVARMHVSALCDRHCHELAVDLRLHPDLGCPHHANDIGRRSGTTLGIDQNAPDEHEHDRSDGGTPSPVHVPVLS